MYIPNINTPWYCYTHSTFFSYPSAVSVLSIFSTSLSTVLELNSISIAFTSTGFVKWMKFSENYSNVQVSWKEISIGKVWHRSNDVVYASRYSSLSVVMLRRRRVCLPENSLFSTVGDVGRRTFNDCSVRRGRIWLARAARSVPADDAQRPDAPLQAVGPFKKKRTRSPASRSLCRICPLNRTYQVLSV